MPIKRQSLFLGGLFSLVLAVGVALQYDFEPTSEVPPKPDLPKPAALAELAKPFKIAMEVKSGDREVLFDVFFLGDLAVEPDPKDLTKAAAIYDLKKMNWYEVRTGKMNSLSDCEKWASGTLKRTQESLKKSNDPKFKNYMQGLLFPKFETRIEKHELIVANEVLEYRIVSSQTYSESQGRRIFAYDELNTYRKAIKKLTNTFAQIDVGRILQARKMFMNKVALTINSPKGTVKTDVKMQIVDLTSEETKKVAEMIKRAAPKP